MTELAARAQDSRTRLSSGITLKRAVEPAPDELTEEQRQAFLQAIQDDPTLGNAAALRQVGVPGTKRDLHALIEREDGLEEASRLARGWNPLEPEDALWRVARDTEHKLWFQAVQMLLKANVQRYAADATLDVTIGGTVKIEDRSASLADLARVLDAAGALAHLQRDPALPDVPGLAQVLAAPVDG